jgi:DNA-binding transcriptional MocR family regulator
MIVHKSITGSTAVEIASAIERAVRVGELEPDESLPTVRACAESLGVSPATVSSAYRILRERGVIVTRGRAGTRVSPQPPLPTSPAFELPEGTRDLALGNPDRQLLPELAGALSAIDPEQRLYGEALKAPALIALSAAQLRADGIPAEHITIVSGALDAVERVLSAQLRPGDAVAVEDPAFSGVLSLLQTLGMPPRPVPIDDFGLLPDALAEVLRSGVGAVVLTPRAQNPTGAALDPKRAKELRRVLAKHPEVLVVEDDHAGPVAGTSAETLCLERAHWAVARSHAKALGPDLRVAILAGDEETIARVEGRQLLGMRWVSHLLQHIVVALQKQKGMKAQLRKAAQTYTRRRRALIDALAEHGIAASGRSGLNVWVPVPEEGRVMSGLLDAGWAVSAGERFRLQSGPALRITTATLEPEEAVALAADLAALLAPGERTLGA